jgi:hypothetical protein
VVNKTVYPIPGVRLPGIVAEQQSVDETWAAELVSTGAFSYTDMSDDAKQGLINQEVRRVMDAQQSDSEIQNAKLEDKLAKKDKLPPEAITAITPNPVDPGQPRAIAGIDSSAIKSAVDKIMPKGQTVEMPSGVDQSGGLQVTTAESQGK